MEMHYSRELPVAGTWDVLVCGAGPTGIAAAVTAARQGYGVLLLERYGAVGGNLTLGNVSPVMGGVAPGTFAEEVDRQMERFGYQLQMNVMSLKQYSEMMGGNLDALRDSMKGMAEAKVKQMVLLDAVAEAEKVEVTADDIAEEYKKLADSYKMDEEKVKQMLSEDDIKGNLESRKAAKLIVDAAVAVAPVEEKAEEAAESKDAE